MQKMRMMVMENLRGGMWMFCLAVALGGCGDGNVSNAAEAVNGEDIVEELREACAQHSDCDDGSECTKDLCGITKRCEHVVEVGRACNDGDPCTQGALCMEDGACGGPSVAPMPAPPCFECTCDSVDGMLCDAAPEGSECVDQNPCTIDAICSEEGKCAGDSPCIHGACLPQGESFECACDVGWTGTICDQSAD